MQRHRLRRGLPALCATFLVFADYSRPPMRIASLSHLPVIYIYTHDSVGVGEDGPTHQPVETVSALRLIPHFQLIRPADPEETAGAFAAALERTEGRPCSPDPAGGAGLEGDSAAYPPGGRPEGRICRRAGNRPPEPDPAGRRQRGRPGDRRGEGIGRLHPGRVVPSFERFDAQPAEYRDAILPPDCRRRVAIEAGVPDLWRKYVGLDGKVVGISRFGLSAPAPQAFEALGITTKNLVAVARSF